MARQPGRLHGYRIGAILVVQTIRKFDYDVENGWYGVRLMGPGSSCVATSRVWGGLQMRWMERLGERGANNYSVHPSSHRS